MTKTRMTFENPLLEVVKADGDYDTLMQCMTCGICLSRCSWQDGEDGPNPRQMVRMATLGLLDELAKSSMLWNCMICNRCVVECPMGINMEHLVRRARALPKADELIPKDYKRGIPLRFETGNVNGITTEDYIDTLEWLSEELQMELKDDSVSMPIDQHGAKYLYLPNPREISLIPTYLVAIGKMLHATGESWTTSSKLSDVTNWGYYIGDDEVARKMAMQVVEACEELEIENLVLSECGHGYKVLRHMLEELIGRKAKFRIMNSIEMTVLEMEAGRLSFDKTVNDIPVAYHDPCNIGRKSGLFDEPRKLLNASCMEVVELEPNRMHALCCGGGGGILQDSGSTARRMLSGKSKADQIVVADVKKVATSCLSCHRQLGELSKHYKLGVDVTTVMTLAAKALEL